MDLKPQKPPIKRGKSGCWGCKERRKRCTEEKPSCKACSKKQVKCEYGIRLLWEDEAEKAGIAFGRAGMRDRFSKDKKVAIPHFLLPIPSRKVLFLNTTSGDVHRFYHDGRLSTTCAPCFEKQQFSYGELYSARSLPTIPPRLRQYPNLDQDCRFLLDYYMNVVCNRRVLLDGNQNPFRMIVLPLCLSSQALLHAVVAASANDLRNGIETDKSKRYEATVLFHKSKSLSLLCKSLSTYTATTETGDLECPNTSRAERDSMLLTVMMLCYLEIATGSRHEWIAHLNGATSLLNLYHNRKDRTSRDLFSSETIEFVHNYLSLRDTFSATALDEDSYFKNERLHPSSDCGDPTRINIYIGLSPELLDIISSITLLARSKYRKRRRQKENSTLDEKNSDREAAVALHGRLDNLRQWSEETDPNHLIYLNSAAFKEATYIYLRHGAYEDPTDHPSIQEEHLPKLLKLLHQIHAKQGNLLGSLPYPMWALFIAACVVSERDRVAVLGFFTDLNRSRPISNVPPTMSAVKAVWKMKNLDEGCEKKDNSSKGAGGALRLGFEWEEALDRLGWKMALT